MAQFYRPPYMLNDFYMGDAPSGQEDPATPEYLDSVRRQMASDAMRQEGILGGFSSARGRSVNWGPNSAASPTMYPMGTIPLPESRRIDGIEPQGTFQGSPTQNLSRPQPQQPMTPIRDNRAEIARLQQGREDPRQAQRIQYLQRQNANTRMESQNPQFAQNREAIQRIQNRMASGNMGENRMARAQQNIAAMRTQNRGFRNG